METESEVNLKVVAEGVKGMIGPARDGSFDSTIDLERLMLDVLLSIDELVRESPGITIEEVTQQEENGNIMIDLTIATEESGDMAAAESHDRKHTAECLVLDTLQPIDELVHEFEGFKIQNIIQNKIRGKIAVVVQIVAEEIAPVLEPVDVYLEEDLMDVEAPLHAGSVY